MAEICNAEPSHAQRQAASSAEGRVSETEIRRADLRCRRRQHPEHEPHRWWRGSTRWEDRAYGVEWHDGQQSVATSVVRPYADCDR